MKDWRSYKTSSPMEPR